MYPSGPGLRASTFKAWPAQYSATKGLEKAPMTISFLARARCSRRSIFRCKSKRSPSSSASICARNKSCCEGEAGIAMMLVWSKTKSPAAVDDSRGAGKIGPIAVDVGTAKAVVEITTPSQSNVERISTPTPFLDRDLDGQLHGKPSCAYHIFCRGQGWKSARPTPRRCLAREWRGPFSAVPVVIHGSALDAPAAGRSSLHPIQRLGQRLRMSCCGKRPLNGGPRLGIERLRIGRNKQGRSAARHQVQPPRRKFPRDVRRDRSAIGVQGEEGPVLRSAKRQRVHTHAASPIELATAGIVAGALQLEQPRAEVAESVTAYESNVACGLADGAVERQRNLGGCLAPVREMPPGGGKIRRHGEAPPAQQVEAGVIMLHQLETPRNRAANVLADEFQHVGDRRINRGVWRAFTASETGTGWNRSRSIQRANPDAWTHAALFHLGGETGHVGETGIAALPGSRCIRDLPAVVDHHERPVLANRRQIGSPIGFISAARRAMSGKRELPRSQGPAAFVICQPSSITTNGRFWPTGAKSAVRLESRSVSSAEQF